MAIRACCDVAGEVIGNPKYDWHLAVTRINKEVIQRFPARGAYYDLAEAKNGVDPG
jgi:hypothetical protein